jgi:hypothetical protein|tara:strand:+ start:496 stop:666 length:171 start_codon:yes stop_codon:yes gene_type:complete
MKILKMILLVLMTFFTMFLIMFFIIMKVSEKTRGELMLEKNKIELETQGSNDRAPP